MKKTKPDNCRHPAGQGNNRPRCCSAFTLVEVNIALLLIAFALFALISLFPVGLRQSDQSHSDTVQAAFADQVLTALRANAAAVTNWTVWADTNQLTSAVLSGVLIGGQPILADGNPHPIPNYLVSNGYISYSLHIQASPSAPPPSPVRMYLAWIQITDRQNTDLTKSPVYATGFSYLGM
jgi:type II secretory pathway pseudopilin PulG